MFTKCGPGPCVVTMLEAQLRGHLAHFCLLVMGDGLVSSADCKEAFKQPRTLLVTHQTPQLPGRQILVARSMP